MATRRGSAFSDGHLGKSVKLRFGWGPKDGIEGMHQNVALVKTTREAVGVNVDIMADAYMGWNLEYARSMRFEVG